MYLFHVNHLINRPNLRNMNGILKENKISGRTKVALEKSSCKLRFSILQCGLNPSSDRLKRIWVNAHFPKSLRRIDKFGTILLGDGELP